MRYSGLTSRVGGEGADAWEVHRIAMERLAAGEDIIVLSVGEEMDMPTPAGIVDSAIRSLAAGRHHYAPYDGEPVLRDLISAAHRKRTGQAVDRDNIAVFAGAQNALFATMLCLLDPGDEVIAVEPYYTTYPAALSASGAKVVSATTSPDDGFQLSPANIAAAITAKTRAVVINSPNNPTGEVYRQRDIEAVAELCIAHDLWLVSDEVYHHLTFGEPAFSPSSIPELADRCIVISSLSKSHRMAGWRLGWTVASPEATQHLVCLVLCMLYGAPPFVQDAAVTALRDQHPELDEVCANFARRRDRVCERINAIAGLQAHRPDGGMFVMTDIRALGVPTETFAMNFLAEHGVSVLPAEGFGRSAAGHLRVGLVADDATLDVAMDRLEQFVADLRRAEVRTGTG